jgi:hypothetical protein
VRAADIGYLHILFSSLAEHVELNHIYLPHIHACIGVGERWNTTIFNGNADTVLVANINAYILGKTFIRH